MTTGHREHEPDYGYLSYQHHIVLNLEEVNRLVRTVTEELGTCGLTTPFLFSSLTIDIISARVCRLIQAFLHICVLCPCARRGIYVARRVLSHSGGDDRERPPVPPYLVDELHVFNAGQMG
jgi:hypothetical protein